MEMTGGDVREVLLPIFKAQAQASGHDLTDDQIEIDFRVDAGGAEMIRITRLAASVTVEVPDSTPS